MHHKDIDMFVYFDAPPRIVSSKIPKRFYFKSRTEEIHYSSTPQEGLAYISTEGSHWLVRNTSTNASKIIRMKSLDDFKDMPGAVISSIDESTYKKYLEQFSALEVDRIVFTIFDEDTYCVLSTYENDEHWNIYCANKFMSVRAKREDKELHYLLRGQYKSHVNLQVSERDIPYPLNAADEDEVFNNTMLGVDYTVLNEVVQMYEYCIGEFEKMQKTYKMRYL